MNRHLATAQVIDFAVAREQLPGERGVERLCDGRRKGDHGNRLSPPMKARIIADLEETLEDFGVVTVADKKECAKAAGVTLRTVNRVWERRMLNELHIRQREYGQQHQQDDEQDDELTGCVETCDDDNHGRGCRGSLDDEAPAWMVKFNERGRKLQLTRSEIALFTSHSHTNDAIAAVRAIDGHRLNHYCDATLYKAWGNVSEPIRVGARYNSTRQRAIEGTWPLSGRDMVNDSWSIDEYDLKVNAHLRGHVVQPKLLVVRDRFSGLPLARLVLHRAARATDVARVLGAAAIGYTVPGYHPDGSDLRVSGVARYLNSDQATVFIGDEALDAARKLGISNDPSPSNQPQANGDHEVMHQTLLRYFADGGGWRRGWEDRAGKAFDHGLPPYEAILESVDEVFTQLIEAAITKGQHKGMTRLDAYARGLDEGLVYEGPVITEADEAGLAQFVVSRQYDPTRGIELGGRYFLSQELANRAVKSQLLHVHQLVDPDVIYVFDTHGRFIATAGLRDNPDPADQHGLLADRAKREAFVKNAGDVRSIRARTAAADDDRRWAEDVEGPLEEAVAAPVVADAAAATTSSPASRSSTSAAPAPPAPPAAGAGAGAGEVDDAAAQHSGEREALEVVRTSTSRTRKPRKPVHDLAALEAEEEARAARLEAARRQPQPPDSID